MLGATFLLQDMNHKSKESLFDPILHTNTKYERQTTKYRHTSKFV